MKKYLIAVVMSVFANNAIAAEAPQVKLGGSLNTQIGSISNKGRFKHEKSDVTKGELNSTAIVNDTRIFVDVTGKGSNGIKYGARVELFADASASPSGNTNNADRTYLFAESAFGRLEGGALKGASNQMAINASSIAAATGGVDGAFNNWLPKVKADAAPAGSYYSRYQTTPGLPTYIEYISAANKINYFSPKIAGFQFGVSYVPDVQMRGTVSQTHVVTKEEGRGYRNVIDASVKYERKVYDVDYAASFGAEFGDAKRSTAGDAKQDLKAWVAGAKAGYKGFTVAASYGDWMKSGTPKTKVAGKKYGTEHWTLGAAYTYNDFGISATYLEAKRGNSYSDLIPATQDSTKNKFKLLSLGADYKLAQGFKPYVEVSFFEFNRKAEAYNNKGNIALIGTKLTF